MFEKYFSLKKNPFKKTPDPEFLYLSRSHREAYERMMYAIEEKEIMLLTGGVGVGKTTLSRYLIDRLQPQESFRFVLILNPNLPVTQLLRTIAASLGIEKIKRGKSAVLEQIQDVFFRFYEDDISCVIILDESQLIRKRDTYEELRLLTNFQLDDENLFTLIILGQNELEARIDSEDMEAFKQRIGVRYCLKPLNIKEAKEYIYYRLSIAGGSRDILDPDIFTKVFKYSKGTPRIINNIMSLALLSAFSLDKKQITPDIIQDVAKELNL
jgi:type II secretory pathway predicted ATPase ExeA